MNSGFTVHEMESVARRMGPGPDLNVIEISDLGSDSLGLNMLANSGRPSESKQVSFNPSAGFGNSSSVGGGLSEIEIGSVQPVEPITLNLGGGPGFMSGPPAPVEIQFSKAQDDSSNSAFGSGGLFSNSQTASGPLSSLSPAPTSRLSPEEEKKEKNELLAKLQRLEAKGIAVSRRYTMDNTLEEIKQEYARLVDSRNLEASLRFQRQALMSVVTGMEWMNGRFDPFDLKLDGWSESVHENVEDFDEIFEELYDKYKERGKMPPEARLVMALAGSGFMCHVSNTFLRSRMPNMDDVLKNNPEIARQFASAAAKQAGPGFGNFMSMAMNRDGPAPSSVQGVAQEAGAFFGANGANSAPVQTPQSVAAMEPRPTARREMKGPSGVDDILKTFEEVRRNEVLDGTAISQQMSRTVRAEEQPAMSHAIDMQSMGSDDIGSTTESARVRRAGRRRAMPLGSTMELNV
jgi:hypothetical protein